MNEPSDWELVALARTGDDQAFARLVRRYQQGVVAFCQRMVGSRDDAEDLAQDSFIRVYGIGWARRGENFYRLFGRPQPDADSSAMPAGGPWQDVFADQ